MSGFRQDDFSLLRISSLFKPYSYINDLSGDLKTMLAFLLITIGFVFIPIINETLLRYIVGFGLIMFVPGYTFIAAMFPGNKDVGCLERLLLSFACSISIVPIIGFILNFTQWGVRLEPVLACIAVFTIVCTLIANKRRHDLPEDRRFAIEARKLWGVTVAYAFSSDDRFTGRALTGILILSMLILTLMVGYMLIAGGEQECYTELYLLDSNGTVNDYPRDYYLGYPQPVLVGVVNHEHRDVTYDLLISLDNGTTNKSLYIESFTLGHNQTREKPITLMPDAIGDGMKLKVDLFTDGNSIPYREVYLWVNVSVMGEKYTAFNVTGYNGGSIESYARNWNIEGRKGFPVEIVNHEYREVPYVLEIALADQITRTVLYREEMVLVNKQKWAKNLVLLPDRVGTGMTLEFNLYADSNVTVPYKMLRATTNVFRLPGNTTATPGNVTATGG